MGKNYTSLLCSVHGKEVFYAAKRGGKNEMNKQQNFLTAGILSFRNIALLGIKIPVPIQTDP